MENVIEDGLEYKLKMKIIYIKYLILLYNLYII